ncbi:MAG: hypothetical protein HQL57_07495 [Magnetococcales bacterium]|nr:hypothetical protein [Magnetococcales bacterium]
MSDPLLSRDLRFADPTWLSKDPAALAWILDVVDELPEWDDHVAALLDFAFRMRLARLLRTHAGDGEFRKLNRTIRRVAHPIREKKLNALDVPYAVRWQVLVDLLEDRLAVMNREIPELVRSRRWVREILERIRHGQEVSQRDLLRSLPEEVEEANLSRILTLMEGWELVIRHRRKKEKFVSLGPRANELLEAYALPDLPSRAELEAKVTGLESEVAGLKRKIARLEKANIGELLRINPPLDSKRCYYEVPSDEESPRVRIPTRQESIPEAPGHSR